MKELLEKLKEAAAKAAVAPLQVRLVVCCESSIDGDGIMHSPVAYQDDLLILCEALEEAKALAETLDDELPGVKDSYDCIMQAKQKARAFLSKYGLGGGQGE